MGWNRVRLLAEMTVNSSPYVFESPLFRCVRVLCSEENNKGAWGGCVFLGPSDVRETNMETEKLELWSRS